jgi:uncharacterized protein
MTEQEIFKLIADELEMRQIQVENTIELLDTGNTVPFIASYRKKKTGSLHENQIVI